ncbi:hypothetical protein [Streptomyces sp. NPDC102476]|uniref:hypothetical protein n=1 Tax=Streptomyces sp. NPDC102476 TaxID=3366181 RepID=UPI0038266EF3
MSETTAGTSGDRARERTTAWREGVDVLAASRPSVAVRRVAAGHDLVVTHEQVLAHTWQPARLAEAAAVSPGPQPARDSGRPVELVDTS